MAAPCSDQARQTPQATSIGRTDLSADCEAAYIAGSLLPAATTASHSANGHCCRQNTPLVVIRFSVTPVTRASARRSVSNPDCSVLSLSFPAACLSRCFECHEDFIPSRPAGLLLRAGPDGGMHANGRSGIISERLLGAPESNLSATSLRRRNSVVLRRLSSISRSPRRADCDESGPVSGDNSGTTDHAAAGSGLGPDDSHRTSGTGTDGTNR